MTKTKRNLRDDLLYVRKINVIGQTYSNDESLFCVKEPHKIMLTLKKEVKEYSLTDRIKKEMEEATGESIDDVEKVMEECGGKIWLAHIGISVLKRPKYDGDIPVLYPYNIDKKRSLCCLLASRNSSAHLIRRNNPLVEELIQNIMDYLNLRRERDSSPFADHRGFFGLNYKNEKAARTFLKSYKSLRNHAIEKGANFEKFILMASLSAVYSDIMSTFAGNKGELCEYGIAENIAYITSRDEKNGELIYWSESYFHSRFSQTGKFWQMIRANNK